MTCSSTGLPSCSHAIQVTFPLFLFSKILYCNQDWSNDPCPDVTQAFADVWMLLFWPLVVVGVGFAVGAGVSWATNTPHHQRRAVLAACGFSNSTGLPITLLTVVHTNFRGTTSDLGRIDPTLFLSVYLLLYPVLQWGIGGWLLAPEEEDEEEEEKEMLSTEKPQELEPEDSRRATLPEQIYHNVLHNVLNNKGASDVYLTHRRGLSSNDEGMYMSELDLVGLLEKYEEDHPEQPPTIEEGDEEPEPEQRSLLDRFRGSGLYSAIPRTPNTSARPSEMGDAEEATHIENLVSPEVLSQRRSIFESLRRKENPFDVDTLWEVLKNVGSRCFQPPVIGAIAGIICAALPSVRGIFVDIESRSSSAPLEWIFDGLYSVGLTAVPINMMILGCNLSASQQTHTKAQELGAGNKWADGLLPWETMIGVVIGKMIICPMIGILLGWLLKNYVLLLPDDIDASFYLVVMIVFLTPTANNVMVMVELSGSGAKEGIATVIALQYAVAPLVLSLSLTIAVGVADGWS